MSDYQNIEITTDESIKAITIAKDIRGQLIEIFHV
jgi:hypothetical protein